MNSNFPKNGLLALALAAMTISTAGYAHGSTKPKHGGIVQIVGETSLELAAQPTGVELYLLDEGDEIASAGVDAKLTILDGKGTKSEVALKPAGGNKLEAKGVKIAKGSKVTVLVTEKATQAQSRANFTIN